MGVPATPRNIFPSNIQGLPTWYEVRISEAGPSRRARRRRRPDGGDEPADLGPGRRARSSRAATCSTTSTKPMPPVEVPRGHHGARRAADRDDQQGLHRLAAAPVVQEHRLSRRAVGAAGHGHRGDRETAGRAVPRPRQADRRERAGAAHGPRLGAGQPAMPDRPARCATPTRSATASSSTATPPRRWARCMAARRSAPGIRSRRRRRWPRRSPASARRYRVDKETKQEQVRHRAGRGRTGLDRHGDRRRLERRARLHRDLRARHLADAGVHRAGVFRRNPRGDLRRAALRPVHRHADAHAADRHHQLRLCLARRHQARAAVPGRPARVLRVRRAGVRSGGPAANADLRHARPGDRHERAADQAVRLGRQPQAWTAAR